MLVRLPRKAHLGPAVQPLNLSQTCVSPGTQCLISGWGAVSSPKGTALPTKDTLMSYARGLKPLSARLCFFTSMFYHLSMHPYISSDLNAMNDKMHHYLTTQQE